MDVFLQMFIDPVKWDAARWKATAFFHDPKGVRPPCLGIVFDNIGTGKQIFSDWLKRLGNVDQYDELRIGIVEGEILGMGPGYSVHISSDPDHTAECVFRAMPITVPRRWRSRFRTDADRSEEHTSELQSPCNLVCRLLLEKKTN